LYKVQPTSAYYQQNLAELKDIIDTDKQTEDAKGYILLEIARRAAAWAGGVNPDTGQRMEGSPVSQFATAASGLPKTIGEQMAAVRAQEQKLKLAAYQGAQTRRAAAIGRATETFELGPGAVRKGRDPEDPSKFITIAKGGEKVRTPVPMIALMSDGKRLFFDQVVDPGGNKKITAYQELKPKTTVTEIFKARGEPVPKALPRGFAPQMAYTLFDVTENGEEIQIRTPPFNMAEPGTRTTTIDDVLKARGLTRKDMVPGSSKTHKVAPEAGEGKVSLSTLRGYGLDRGLATRYGGKTLLADYNSASKAGKKSIKDQLGRYEAALLQQISPSFDKDLGKTVDATGLSAAGEQAVRDRLSLLDKLETWYEKLPDADKTEKVKAQYKSDKRLLTVSSRLKAHITRMDAASLAGKELKKMEVELQRLKAGEVTADEGIAGEVNRFLKEGKFNFRDIGGGIPGALSGWLSKIGSLFQADVTPDREGAIGAWKDLAARSTKIVSQLDRVSTSDSTRAFLIDIKALNKDPESAFTNLGALLRRAGEFRGVLESSLEDTLLKAGVAEDARDALGLARHYGYARTLRKMLFSWVYVENSLRGGALLNVPTSEDAEAALEKLKGGKN
jgi:hypothetical protein